MHNILSHYFAIFCIVYDVQILSVVLFMYAEIKNQNGLVNRGQLCKLKPTIF